jgi:16S rRNA (guanine527-N7)-methyltransferase
MFAANFANFSHGRLADVGSGAGFPGLALKILHPDLQIQLIESNGRKCSFLKEIIRSLDLTSARVAHERLEEHDSESVHLDFVTARALGQFESLLSWAKDALKPTGNLILWLGMNDAAKIALHHSWTWGPPNVIPGSKSRVILVGSPRAS